MNLFAKYLTDRLFEWVMTSSMLGVAINLALWPESISVGAFRLILQVISASNMGLFFLAFGIVRIIALVANGSWPKHGPRLRALGACAAAFMWAQMSAALLLLALHPGALPSIGIPIYFCLSVGELISAYRAICDDARHSG